MRIVSYLKNCQCPWHALCLEDLIIGEVSWQNSTVLRIRKVDFA